jgi:hypothetical protein
MFCLRVLLALLFSVKLRVLVAVVAVLLWAWMSLVVALQRLGTVAAQPPRWLQLVLAELQVRVVLMLLVLVLLAAAARLGLPALAFFCEIG